MFAENMDYSRPTLMVISGPNGAGKSTFIQSMLPDEFNGISSFNRDEIRIDFENQLVSQGTPKVDRLKKATMMMEERLIREMKEAIFNKGNFVLETPLSDPYYWTYLNLFDDAGYQNQLIYLCLDTIDQCKARVQQRILEGGHAVSPETIEGVYNMNLFYLNTEFTDFDRLEFYDGTIFPTLLCALENNDVEYLNPLALRKNWLKKGLPLLYKTLKDFKEDVDSK